MTKKDILELRKRLNKKGCTFTRMRGCYVDSQKNIVLHINETFLSLEEEEFYKYLEIAKKVLSGTEGNNLLELPFLRNEDGEESQKFFLAMRDSGLEDDGLLDLFYERVIESYEHEGNYLILLFHDAYDIPLKTKDNMGLDESTEVYTYFLCAVCPMELSKAGLGYRQEEHRIGVRIRDWVVHPPASGFVFPAFTDRSTDIHSLMYYTRDPKKPHEDFMEEMLGCQPKKTAVQEKKAFQQILEEALPAEVEDTEGMILDIQQNLSNMVDEHKTVFENEPVFLDGTAIHEILTDEGLSTEVAEQVEQTCTEVFGDTMPLAESLISQKELEARAKVKKEEALQLELLSLKDELAEQKEAAKEREGAAAHGSIILNVDEEKADAIKTEIIDGQKYILIPVSGEERTTINGEEASF